MIYASNIVFRKLVDNLIRILDSFLDSNNLYLIQEV